MRFNSSEMDTIQHALRNAVISHREHAATMRLMGIALADGHTHALFAPGEAGATAARRLAESHEDSATECEVLLDKIEDED